MKIIHALVIYIKDKHMVCFYMLFFHQVLMQIEKKITHDEMLAELLADN